MAFYKEMRMQQENVDTGRYQVTVLNRADNRPVENARVRISYTGAPDSVLEEVVTDSSGRTPVIELEDTAPGIQYGTGGGAALCRIYGTDPGRRV